jgi:hypothetical protein
VRKCTVYWNCSKASLVHIVAYRPVAKLWLCKQWPLLGNARNIHTCNNRTMGLWNPFLSNGLVNTFLWRRRRDTTIQLQWKWWCFLLGPSQGCIVRTLGQLRQFSWKSVCEEKTRRLVWNGCQPGTQLVEGCQLRGSSVRQAVKKRDSCKRASVKRRLSVWYLECVIQWDCYSSCVKSIARKRLVETVIDWGH